MNEKLYNPVFLLLLAVIIIAGCGPSDRVEELISEMKSSDVTTRQRAVWELVEVGDSRAVPVLIAALKDADSVVRGQAARTLGRIGDKRAVELLLASLKDEDWEVRAHAVIALGEFGDKRAVVPLIAALEDDESDVRFEATRALCGFGDARAIEPLVRILNDRKAEVRCWGVQALACIGKPAIDKVIEALENEHEDVRREAVNVLGSLREEGVVSAEIVVPCLIEGLKRKDGNQRWQVTVAVALSQIGKPAVEPLIKALEDKDKKVRYWVADTLKEITGMDFGEDKAKWKAWHEKNKDK